MKTKPRLKRQRSRDALQRDAAADIVASGGHPDVDLR